MPSCTVIDLMRNPQKSETRPFCSQSPNLVGSAPRRLPRGPPTSPVTGFFHAIGPSSSSSMIDISSNSSIAFCSSLLVIVGATPQPPAPEPPKAPGERSGTEAPTCSPGGDCSVSGVGLVLAFVPSGPDAQRPAVNLRLGCLCSTPLLRTPRSQDSRAVGKCTSARSCIGCRFSGHNARPAAVPTRAPPTREATRAAKPPILIATRL